ncbi:DUF1327 domain-containing protein [Escherichia coli]|uniref:DUF1327 domain-containing protein n=1 Tax=Escherichia coli TaxID=562 RepID=UPI0020251C49|nr:DUF1327 domain-containing protein [Escherichia coli]
MKKKYELVVKGINNYPDKITVTVALEIGGYPSLLLPDVAISLDRTEGATLEFYEADYCYCGTGNWWVSVTVVARCGD